MHKPIKNIIDIKKKTMRQKHARMAFGIDFVGFSASPAAIVTL
jgi:hypothetical protein